MGGNGTETSLVKSTVSGALSGAVSVGILHPIDLVKIRYQVGKCKGISYRKAFRQLYNEQGFKGLYRGSQVSMLASTLAWGIFFCSYTGFKSIYSEFNNGKITSFGYMFTSLQAGIISIVLVNPLWVLKTRICVQKANDAHRYVGINDGLRSIYATEGLRGLYRGMGFGIFSSFHGSIQFLIYEKLKTFSKLDNTFFRNSNDKKNVTSFFSNFALPLAIYTFSAAVSKLAAMLVTYPLQVLKSTAQSHESDVSNIIKMKTQKLPLRKNSSPITYILKVDGIKGFYRGLGLNLIRTIPSSCISLGSYELFMVVFNAI